ncbi:hypothetical protein DPMN_187166 [Dreissena polymorpha]|uniref:Uncharacterized protein n=1 Tax=Dreissena polymorpha TaxID=45954 RepID=A0A9D4I8T4_DREPO|nr:hypothetical protein DPMN_187166 [Dreissena polymorpha]
MADVRKIQTVISRDRSHKTCRELPKRCVVCFCEGHSADQCPTRMMTLWSDVIQTRDDSIFHGEVYYPLCNYVGYPAIHSQLPVNPKTNIYDAKQDSTPKVEIDEKQLNNIKERSRQHIREFSNRMLLSLLPFNEIDNADLLNQCYHSLKDYLPARVTIRACSREIYKLYAEVEDLIELLRAKQDLLSRHEVLSVRDVITKALRHLGICEEIVHVLTSTIELTPY